MKSSCLNILCSVYIPLKERLGNQAQMPVLTLDMQGHDKLALPA